MVVFMACRQHTYLLYELSLDFKHPNVRHDYLREATGHVLIDSVAH